MDFRLTEEQHLLRKSLRNYMRREVAPVIAEYDAKQEFPKEVFRQLGEMGCLGVFFPESLGGAGLGYLEYVIIMEEIGRVDGSTALGVAAHNSLGSNHIFVFGSDEQKQAYMPKLARGEWLAAWALTEPGSGSDSAGMTTTAVRDGDHYVLNGTKNFITHGSVGQVCVVMAKTDPDAGHQGISAFIVETDRDGYSVGRKEDKLGWRSSDTAQVVLEDCRVPVANRLGEEGTGFGQAMTVLAGGRVGIAALGLSNALGALDEAILYAKERKAFGRPIAEFQAMQFMLADMQVRCEAARMLCYRAATLRDQGHETVLESSMAKLYSTEAAEFNARDAVQIHGGYGCIKEYAVERHFRDAKLGTIGEGTSEIQRLVIAKELLKGTAISVQDLMS